MSFLALGATLMAALALATAGLILFLYWLKPPPQRVVVPSTFIWSLVLKERKRRLDFWRWLVSLLVALAVGLALAGAIGRPEIEALSGGARRVVVVVDNSPTMGARTASGGTRFDAAVARAGRLLAQGGASREYLVTDTAGSLGGREFGSRRTALERLEGLQISLDESASFPSGDPALFTDASTEVYLFTDGVLVREAPPGVRIVSVFEPVDNVGITAFDLRSVPAEPNRFEAFLELVNHSKETKRVALRIDGAGGQSVERAVALSPGQVLGESLELDRFQNGPVRALIDAPGDGYELDNVAYAYLGAPRQARVLLVTRGNDFLEALLGLDPRVLLEVVPPERVASVPTPDLFVFDGFAPAVAPAAPSLLIRPTPADWLPPIQGGDLENLSLAGTERDHPIMEHVALDDVVVERALSVARGPHRVAAGSDEEPIILVGESPVRFAELTFALADSNLPLQSGFPVLLSNAVGWLAGTEVVVSPLGTIAVPVGGAVVTDIDGHDVPSRSSGTRTSFAPTVPGLFSVKGEREVVVSANLLSPLVSAVNDSVLGTDSAGAQSEGGAGAAAGSELWVGLVLFALVLALIEWWTYHRRLTV